MFLPHECSAKHVLLSTYGRRLLLRVGNTPFLHFLGQSVKKLEQLEQHKEHVIVGVTFPGAASRHDGGDTVLIYFFKINYMLLIRQCWQSHVTIVIKVTSFILLYYRSVENYEDILMKNRKKITKTCHFFRCQFCIFLNFQYISKLDIWFIFHWKATSLWQSRDR